MLELLDIQISSVGATRIEIYMYILSYNIKYLRSSPSLLIVVRFVIA